MVLTPGDRGLDREQGVPERAGPGRAPRSRPARRTVPAGQQAGDCWSGVGGWIAVVRGDPGGLPARHLHPQGRRPGQGARRRQRDRQVGGELDLRRARSKWRRSGTAAWPSSRFGTCSWTRVARSRGQGWPQATRQGLALTPARTPPHCCKPRIRSRSRRRCQWASAGSTSCATCSLRSRRATPTGSLPQSAPSSPNRTPRRAPEPPVLRCPALANHRDPVTTNHLPGGKPESAAKTRTARLRRST